MLTGRRISAEEAFNTGLVNRIVSKGELLPTVEGMASRIALLDPMAVRTVKQAVVRGLDLSLPEGLELEKRLASLLLQTMASGIYN